MLSTESPPTAGVRVTNTDLKSHYGNNSNIDVTCLYHQTNFYTGTRIILWDDVTQNAPRRFRIRMFFSLSHVKVILLKRAKKFNCAIVGAVVKSRGMHFRPHFAPKSAHGKTEKALIYLSCTVETHIDR